MNQPFKYFTDDRKQRYWSKIDKAKIKLNKTKILKLIEYYHFCEGVSL